MSSPSTPDETFEIEQPSGPPASTGIRQTLKPLASLKLTVALFGFSIFLVMAGTLAQVEMDIWDVVHDFFRCWFAWVPVRTFHPLFAPYLDLSGLSPAIGMWFPGGYLIGVLMALNLTAAHSLKFTVQAKGPRLIGGLVVTAIGAIATWLVIQSGDAGNAVQEASISWDTLWSALKGLSVLLLLTTGWGVASKWNEKRAEALGLVGVLAVIATSAYFLFNPREALIDDSGMRILWQLIKATGASVIMLAGCMMLFRKRAGVVLLHAGVGLMMLNEVVVDTSHVETQMRINEDESVNYSDDIREFELVFVNRSGTDFDEEIVIPKPLLVQAGQEEAAEAKKLTNEQMPFDVEILQFMQNSNPRDVRPSDDNPATAGPGLTLFAEPVRPGAGTDTDGAVDLTAAYVRVSDKESGKDLGTFLTGVLFELMKRPEWQPNRFEVNGEEWDVFLRFRRHYKPYTVYLKDVSKTDYVGTNTPRDYRSIVQITDTETGAEFEHHIWMNNPLRYSGETFYQSNYGPPDPQTGKESTTLAVVSNTGWMIPYVSCMIVAVGMLAHFWIALVRFLNRRSQAATKSPVAGDTSDAEATSSGEAGSPIAAIVVPCLLTLLVAGWLLGKARVPKYESSEANLVEFGKLPLVYEGRVKPFDTLARNSLRILSNRTSFKDSDGNKQPAILWLLDVIGDRDASSKHRVFRIDHPEIVQKLGLERRKSHLYSLEDIIEKIPDIIKEASAAQRKDSKDRNADERRMVEIANKLDLFDILVSSFHPPEISEANWQADLQNAMRALQRLDQRQPPLSVPPREKTGESDLTGSEEWEPFSRGWLKSYVSVNLLGGEASEPVRLFTEILVAHREGEGEDFNKKVREYHQWLSENAPKDLDRDKASFESFFNYFSPFYYSAFAYLYAFVAAIVGLLAWPRTMNRTAFLIILATFFVHTFALGARIYISGRPPVTNLYSSAVFIGWGCVLLGMVFESIYKLGIGNIIGSSLGAITLGISYLLAGDGDTFKVLQAVLDTQFWLATHVVCITLGYSTTFLSGTLGLYYVLAGVLSRKITPETSKDLSRMIYGTVCFGIFFSFVGTVLGGLWADDSWGRFWGWDPKENGALLIVLWNAIVLHARWDRMVGDRGLAVLAVVGNIITSWSWFGVNELSVGLHAYGFTEGVWATLWVFWLSQAAIVGLGCIPTRLWRSFGPDNGDETAIVTEEPVA